MTERFHFHFSLSCIGEGNGNPLQCSCLENPRDSGAWWADIYQVAQSWTRLKWLSTMLSVSFIWKPSNSHKVANTSGPTQSDFFIHHKCQLEWKSKLWKIKLIFKICWSFHISIHRAAAIKQTATGRIFFYYDYFYFSVPHCISFADTWFLLIISLVSLQVDTVVCQPMRMFSLDCKWEAWFPVQSLIHLLHLFQGQLISHLLYKYI